jgi:hypothetical protein
MCWFPLGQVAIVSRSRVASPKLNLEQANKRMTDKRNGQAKVHFYVHYSHKISVVN